MAIHPLTTRLHQQRDRIAGMLSPGAHRVTGQQPRSISSMLSGFGGLKFQLAARSMRHLNPGNLGRLQPANILRPLVGLLEKAEDLLHLKPASPEDASPWGQVETVFPSSFTEPEAAPEAGVLRPGSVIPRMASFPKPGQSLDSFKKQVEDRPKPAPAPVEIPRPHPAANARRFSRIQEFKTAASNPEIPVDVSAPEEIQPQPETAPKPPVTESQRALETPRREAKIEAAPSELVVPASRSKTSPEALKRSEKAGTSIPTSPRESQAAPLAHPLEPPQASQRKTARKPPVSLSKAVAKVPEKPSQKIKGTTLPLAKAAPTKKKPSIENNQPLPVRKAVEPSSAPTDNPTAPVDLTKMESSKIAPSSQTAMPTPVQETLVPEPSATGPVVPPVPQPVAQPIRPTAEQPQPSPETPIRKSSTYRRQAVGKLKSLQSQGIIPQNASAEPTRREEPLIRPQKYSLATAIVARQPDLASLNPTPGPVTESEVENVSPAAAPAPAIPTQPYESKLPVQESTAPVPMALAYPPRPAAKAPEAPPTAPVPAEPSAQPSPVSSRPPSVATRASALKNTIQRKWKENEGGSGSPTSSGGGAGAPDSPADGAGPGMDLARIAEDVLPYVKRLIEIETDRIGRSR